MQLSIVFSREFERDRVRYTLGKLDWFREQKYRLTFPADIEQILSDGNVPTDEEIAAAVEGEFDEEHYRPTVDKILEGWREHGEDYSRQLQPLGLPVEDEYIVTLTRYGVGGSYHIPNSVIVNIAYGKTDPFVTVLHEIVHLVIEPLIYEHSIEHWTKERLVDLTLSRFRGWRSVQRDPNRAEDIERIFEMHYPDMRGIVARVAEL